MTNRDADATPESPQPTYGQRIAMLVIAGALIAGLFSSRQDIDPADRASLAAEKLVEAPVPEPISMPKIWMTIGNVLLQCSLRDGLTTVQPGDTVYGLATQGRGTLESEFRAAIYLATIQHNQDEGYLGANPDWLLAGNELGLLENCVSQEDLVNGNTILREEATGGNWTFAPSPTGPIAKSCYGVTPQPCLAKPPQLLYPI